MRKLSATLVCGTQRTERTIWLPAEAQAIVVTKDKDFLTGILERTLADALSLLESTESLVVISDAQ